MKSSHKFYAATGGLLVAALMGFAGAHADTGVPEVDASTPIEPVASVPAGGFEVGESAEGKETAAPEKQEAADAEKAPVTTQEKAEKAADEAEVAKSEAESVAKDATEEKSEATEAPKAADSAPTEAKENSEEATTDKAKTTEPSTEKVAEETKEGTSVAAAAGTEVNAESVVPVTYVLPSHSSVAASDDAEEVVTPQPDAQAPLLTMAKTEEAVPSSEKTPNGESQVVFFELPQPAGPALVPGQATPLLNAAVSEEATVNANVVPSTAVQENAAVAQYNAKANASSKVAAETGTLSRSLARTGSIAQYVTLLSAGALILGLAFLVGAVATSRRNSRLVDAE
ncbi:peptidase [Mobiluncus mulieris]|uniref:peptidase n=1 Tax=Mobiluncus mulieris TaxID=2052 RepID=UPI00242E9D6E|nr:peptidase [Mobiluncus mulieris]